MFESLDFIYLPSRDVAAEAGHLIQALGAELVFAIEAFETRVAMLRLAAASPPVLLAEHLEGDQPVLVYSVLDLEATIEELTASGAETGTRFGIPYGPGVELITPGPQRLAVYQLTRPEAGERLAGRRDF